MGVGMGKRGLILVRRVGRGWMMICESSFRLFGCFLVRMTDCGHAAFEHVGGTQSRTRRTSGKRYGNEETQGFGNGGRGIDGIG